MTIPNLITILRFLLVPMVIYAILADNMLLAFIGFVAAGVSDGIDGWLARWLDQRSELGAYLDPVADKLLLTSVFIALGLMQIIPLWLMVIVVSRDLLIVGGVLIAAVMAHPIAMKPLYVSKANTAAQIVLAAMALGGAAFDLDLAAANWVLVVIVAALTVASTAAYLVVWFNHMAGSSAEDA